MKADASAYQRQYKRRVLDDAYRRFVDGEPLLADLAIPGKLSLSFLERCSAEDGWLTERVARRAGAQQTAAELDAGTHATDASAKTGESLDLLDQLSVDIENAYVEQKTRLGARGHKMPIGQISFVAKSVAIVEEARRNRGGRPKKEIVLTAEQVVEQLAEIQCTADEIAAVLGIHRDTVYARFSDQYKKGREVGKSSLRRIQWSLLQSGGPGAATMAVWLGKQYLGQTDKLPDLSKLTDAELFRLAGFVTDPEAGSEGVGDTESSATGVGAQGTRTVN